MDMNKYIRNMNRRFADITESFIREVIEKRAGEHLETLQDKINGVSSRNHSFSYHLDLLEREIYLEKEKIFKICEEKKIVFNSEEFRRQSQHIMVLIMNRATFLLRDIIADFFGALDNLCRIIVLYNKNANGQRISKVVKSLTHEHSRNTELGKYILSEWNLWLKDLYEGYRKDAIHLNPDNCGVSHTIHVWRKNPDIPCEMNCEENININLPKAIMTTFDYQKKVDLRDFAMELHNRLLELINGTLNRLI